MKSLKRYQYLNKRVYSLLEHEMRNHYSLTGPGSGELQIQHEGSAQTLKEEIKLLTDIEDLVTQIITSKKKSKKSYAELYRGNMRTFDNIPINVSTFLEVNQLSPLLSIYDKCMPQLFRRIERLKKTGRDIDVCLPLRRKYPPVPITFIFFCNLIRRQYKFYFSDCLSRFSEHYRRVCKELITHHSCLLKKHERVYSFSLRLPVKTKSEMGFTEAETKDYFKILEKFLNALKKNKILNQKIGYVVSRSIIFDDKPGISIIFFFKEETVREFKELKVINETYSYWTKSYNKNIDDSLHVQTIKQSRIGVLQVTLFDNINLEGYVKQNSAPLALRGDVIKFKNLPQRKKYYSKSEKL